MEMVYAVFDDTDAVEDYKMQKEAEDLIAFAASRGDPYTLSYKDAMGAIDSPDFKTAMVSLEQVRQVKPKGNQGLTNR
jgi:hypothetical protein